MVKKRKIYGRFNREWYTKLLHDYRHMEWETWQHPRRHKFREWFFEEYDDLMIELAKDHTDTVLPNFYYWQTGALKKAMTKWLKHSKTWQLTKQKTCEHDYPHGFGGCVKCGHL